MKIEKERIYLKEYKGFKAYTSGISFYPDTVVGITEDDYVEFLRGLEWNEVIVENISSLEAHLPGLLERKDIECRKNVDANLCLLQHSSVYNLDIFERNQLF